MNEHQQAAERKLFERWYEDDAMPLEADWFRKDEDGDYLHDPCLWGWRAWRARAALEAAEKAEEKGGDDNTRLDQPEPYKTGGGEADSDLINKLACMFFDAQTVKSVPADYAKSAIAAVRRHDAARRAALEAAKTGDDGKTDIFHQSTTPSDLERARKLVAWTFGSSDERDVQSVLADLTAVRAEATAQERWPKIPDDWAVTADFRMGWGTACTAFAAAIREGRE